MYCDDHGWVADDFKYKYYSFKQMDRKRKMSHFVVMLPVVLIFAAITYNIPVGILVVLFYLCTLRFCNNLFAKKMIQNNNLKYGGSVCH